MSQDSQNKISGKKIYCEGHRIAKPTTTKMRDGHTGFSTIVKQGFCIILKEFKWKEKSNLIK